MMQHDYYALKQAELTNTLNNLEQATKGLEEAKQRKDKTAQQDAENEIQRAGRKAVSIEPHLAYLWFWAKREEADSDQEKRRFSQIANFIRDAWQKQMTASSIPADFHFLPDDSLICHMPVFSFLLRVPFRLNKPYLSKDETSFHLLDNPLRKEKVFQTPMIASTSWKGALRATLWQMGYEEPHEVTIRLLGNPRGSDEHQAGRLYFFPTFFDQIGLEVINPHDRQTGVNARGPILVECVPQRARGDLFLLYVPFGPVKQGEAQRRAEIAEDLQILAKGVQAMLTIYGFGAKTSSGFGTAEEKLAEQGKLAIRAKLAKAPANPATPPEEPQPPKLPRYLESPTRLRADLRREDGSLKSEEEYRAFVESQGRKYGKKDKQLYDKAKRWWVREGQALAETASQKPESEPEPASPPAPPVAEFTFHTLSELCDVARQVADELRGGGEA